MQLEGGEDDDDYEVWPDAWNALCLFFDCATQWQIGPSGHATGLRYEVLPVMFELHGIEPTDRRGVVEDLRVCEREAMRIWSQK